jgi:hypothetical protein
MPIFITQQWNDFQIKLTPGDTTRKFLRKFIAKHDIIPYFYGPLNFDLAVEVPKKMQESLSGEEIRYEWNLLSSKDDRIIKSGIGSIRLIEKEGTTQKNGQASAVMKKFRHETYRKKKAISLEHISVLDQYKILMHFENRTGAISEQKTMLEFTLLDRDKFSINLISLLLGAATGILAAIVGFLFRNL